MDANTYERMVERARDANRRLAAALEEVDELPSGPDRRHRALASRTAELLRAMRILIGFARAAAEQRGEWRRRVAAGAAAAQERAEEPPEEVEEPPPEDLTEDDWPFEPPY